MIPYVRVSVNFDPHKDDIGELYEHVRAACEQLRPFGITHMEFIVSMRKDDDNELPTF